MCISLCCFYPTAALILSLFFTILGEHNKPDRLNKKKLEAILFIMDRFSISLSGYHELTQVEQSLPRTHHIERCAKRLDDQWEVKRTPGEAEGAELPFRLLLQHQIRKHVSMPCRFYYSSRVVAVLAQQQ